VEKDRCLLQGFFELSQFIRITRRQLIARQDTKAVEGCLDVLKRL
jgi:hypothetical protein